MNLLIMGPAGAGKGTMSEKITEKYGIPHISSGDMFRAEIAGKTELGLKAQEYMVKGELVPDEITIGMVSNRIQQPDCKNGYLLDGFPRTLPQAVALSELTEKLGIPLEAIVVLTVEYDSLMRRITGRRICPKCGAIYNIYSLPSKVDGICDVCGGTLKQRSDDTEEGLKERLAEFDRQTRPVLDHFADRGLTKEVNASQPIEKVWEDVQKALEEFQ